MDVRKEIDTTNLHHAYMLEDSVDVFDSLRSLLCETHADAEMHVREFESLGVDDSRELVRLAGMRSVGTQLFLYRVHSCTREAQNALLKLFEEPPARTHFFLCVARPHDILPTLRSRVWTLVSGSSDEGKEDRIDEFMHASPAQRIALLEPIVKNKDILAAQRLLMGVETQLHTHGMRGPNTAALKHIIDVRRVLNDKGVSLKVLLESIALTLPPLSTS